MTVPSWVIAIAVAVPLTAGGTIAGYKVYQDTLVVHPEISVNLDENELADRIVEGQARKDAELRAAQKAQDDAYFCKRMRGMPGFDETGACP